MSLNIRIIKEHAARDIMTVLTVSSLVMLVIMFVGLYLKSEPILATHSLRDLLTDSSWKPSDNHFGFFPFLMGSVWVTLFAILLALPISLLVALFLTEYSHSRVKKFVFPVLDILAGFPSVIFGVWGTLVIVPWVSHTIAPHFVENNSGYTVLAAGIVVGVSILPLLISLFIELFNNVSQDYREASMALGATKWQTIKRVLLRKSSPGIIASTALAISRILGETIAVLMVCGNVPSVPHSLLDACYPIPALIANNYGEMLSVPLYESALMFAAFILFFVVLIFNLISRIVLRRIERLSE
ncbi:MAG: phosphate ABC transporter permease subunit PstC [Paludibacteraceae bacterium]|nr:phosphate ABC transporter permease subunit PstC [Paludibacteraceae bacterium]